MGQLNFEDKTCLEDESATRPERSSFFVAGKAKAKIAGVEDG